MLKSTKIYPWKFFFTVSAQLFQSGWTFGFQKLLDLKFRFFQFQINIFLNFVVINFKKKYLSFRCGSLLVPQFDGVRWTNDRRTTVTPTRWGRNRVPCSCCSACWCRDWYAPSHPAKVSLKLPPPTKNTILSRFLSNQELDHGGGRWRTKLSSTTSFSRHENERS